MIQKSNIEGLLGLLLAGCTECAEAFKFAVKTLEVERCYASPPGGDQLRCGPAVDAYVLAAAFF